MKQDRMGILYKHIKKNKFHREETFLPLDTITTAYFSLEEVLSNDLGVVE
ncbi:hypothetical protein Megpolyxen_01670 (plasmid) [Candidatus Megaera polyxenophila]|nr:hypothetical protein Megpolyxen_01670 [Candidatus Megaera polyxenophila]